MTVETIRQTFPHIKSGKVYFNHAAIGPLSIPVKEKLNEYLEERSSGAIENLGMLLEASTLAKKRLASLLGAKKNRIAWTENVSSGLNILAQGLEWKPGDRIILNDLEFPSNVYPFLNLESQGVKVDFAKSHKGKVDIEDYEKFITAKTKVISISAVQFLSGYRANIKELGELCKSKGIIFCVDAIQAAGVVEIDVEEYNIDFLAGGSHKWLMALQGLGYIYITPGLMKRLNPKYVGWLSVKNEWDLIKYKLELKETAARFHLGTNSVIGIFALAKSLEMFESFGIKNIETKNLDNTTYLLKKLTENEIDVVQKDFDKNNLAAITTLKFNKAEKIYNELKERNIIVSLREGMIRISPHFYNTKEDLDYLINQLKDIQRKFNN